MLGWRAHFTGGRVYTSARTEPADLPKDGCLYVVVYTGLETPKRFIHSGEDTYFWWEGPHGLVVGSNSDSRRKNKKRYPGAVFVKGKWTTHREMAEVRRWAEEAHEPPERG